MTVTLEATETEKTDTKDADFEAVVPDFSVAQRYIPRKLAGGKLDTEIFKFAIDNSYNVLLEGPTGAGKTMATMAFAARFKMPFYSVPSHVGAEASELFGKYIPIPSGGFRWQDGPVTYIVRNGGLLLIDEINFLPDKVATVLFSLLDERRSITLMGHNGELIKAHKCDREPENCRPDNNGDCAARILIVAGMNPRYEGTRPLNRALRNRFNLQFDWSYSDLVEKKLIKSSNLRQLAQRLRQQINTRTPISTNMLIEFEKVALFDWELAVNNFVTHFDTDERAEIQMGLTGFSDKVKIDLGIIQPITPNTVRETEEAEMQNWALAISDV